VKGKGRNKLKGNGECENERDKNNLKTKLIENSK